MKKPTIIIIVFIILLSYQTFGQTWGYNYRLTWNAGDSECPSIAVDSSDGIHVVWQDQTICNYEIFYKQSTDGGTNWSALNHLTWTLGSSNNPSIAADSSGGIHVVWEDSSWAGKKQICYKKSPDGGTTWSTLERLTWSITDSKCPSIAADSSDRIHLVWEDKVSEIFYKNSTDSGTTWSASTRLAWNTGDSECPSIAVDSGDVIHVAWQDNTPGNWAIFYKSSTDSGTTWSALTRLTWSRFDSKYPSIAGDLSGGIHLVWQGSHEIYYKQSTDGGSSWSVLTRLTWNTAASEYPDIVAGSVNTIHVVWQDWTWEFNTVPYPEICYKGSSDGGGTWSGLNRLTWTSGLSQNPSIAADSSGAIHLVWEDKNPGNFEIFYKIYK